MLVGGEELTKQIIAAAMIVHTRLGPGLLESAYEAVLAYELRQRSLRVDRQVAVALDYDALHVDTAYRLDLVVNGEVVVEVKSVERLHMIHEVQLLTYLRLAGLPLGLLMNFNTLHLRDGLRRKVNLLRAPP